MAQSSNQEVRAYLLQNSLLTPAQRSAFNALIAWQDGAKPTLRTADPDTQQEYAACVDDEEIQDEPKPCGDCRDGMVEGFNRRGSWAIANYQTCPTCGGSGVVRS